MKIQRFRPEFERLEDRVAPATLIGSNKVTHQDVDGDIVTVTLLKPLLTAGFFLRLWV